MYALKPAALLEMATVPCGIEAGALSEQIRVAWGGLALGVPRDSMQGVTA